MGLPLQHSLRIGAAALTRRVPVYVHYGITHRCDLTCKMCGIWRFGNAAEELRGDQIAQMAQRLKRIGVAQLSIGGGEPFAREDLEEVARTFVSAGLNLRLLTNAVNVPTERLEACVAAGVKNFSISLDSLSPALFDAICEHPGSWEGAVRNMTFLANRLKGSGGTLVMNCVVSALNLEEIPALIRFARDIGFAISLLPVELLPDPKAGVRNWEARFIRYRPEMGFNAATGVDPEGQGTEALAGRIDRIYDEVIRMKREGWPILNSTPYLRASRNYLKTGRFPAEGCDAGRLYFSISPNGQFTICHRTSHGYRHILDPDFETYFQSDEYERQRQMEAGGCEGCMRACWIDTSAMFRTLEGFFDAVRTNFSAPVAQPLSFEQAWARAQQGEVSRAWGV